MSSSDEQKENRQPGDMEQIPENGENNANDVDNKPKTTEEQQGTAIVIALDASDECEHAVKWYLGKIYKPGDRIVFVHIIELPDFNLNQARNTHMSPGVLAQMWKEEEQKTKALEEKMKSLLKEKGLKGTLRTATGKPGETIVSIAEQENAQMVVVGTRGTGKVRRTILGSVSDYLVHHAHCPVVVCRHPETILKQQQRRRHSSASSEGGKSRHTSGDSMRSRNASGEPSGEGKVRTRKWSGDWFKKRSASQSAEVAEEGDE